MSKLQGRRTGTRRAAPLGRPRRRHAGVRPDRDRPRPGDHARRDHDRRGDSARRPPRHHGPAHRQDHHADPAGRQRRPAERRQPAVEHDPDPRRQVRPGQRHRLPRVPDLPGHPTGQLAQPVHGPRDGPRRRLRDPARRRRPRCSLSAPPTPTRTACTTASPSPRRTPTATTRSMRPRASSAPSPSSTWTRTAS